MDLNKLNELGKDKGCEEYPSYIVCVRGKIYTDPGMFAECEKCKGEGIEHCCYGAANNLQDARKIKAEIIGKPELGQEEIEKKRKVAEKRIKDIVKDFELSTGKHVDTVK